MLLAVSFFFDMNRVEQKKAARHIRSKAARRDRFIAAYIMKKNKEAYAEAKQCFDDLDQKYPEKRDLTKTDEFVHKTTEYTSFHKMAQANYQTKKKETDNDKTKSMSLKIQLMDAVDVDIAVTSEKTDESLCIPDHIYNNLLAEISQDPVLSNIFNTVSREQQQEQQQQEMDEILAELDDILPDNPPERSPLEEELEHLVCE